jgi:uncharacterized ferritin-like protein (DUF455 family)
METVAAACRNLLLTSLPEAKVKAARAVARSWRRGALRHAFDTQMPGRPALRSAAILRRIHRDEIRHVAAGTRWFEYGCEARGFTMISHWQRLIRRHCRGALKPPFNGSARDQAGLSREFYEGVAVVGVA